MFMDDPHFFSCWESTKRPIQTDKGLVIYHCLQENAVATY